MGRATIAINGVKRLASKARQLLADKPKVLADLATRFRVRGSTSKELIDAVVDKAQKDPFSAALLLYELGSVGFDVLTDARTDDPATDELIQAREAEEKASRETRRGDAASASPGFRVDPPQASPDPTVDDNQLIRRLALFAGRGDIEEGLDNLEAFYIFVTMMNLDHIEAFRNRMAEAQLLLGGREGLRSGRYVARDYG